MKRVIILHPFFFAAFPVLFLFEKNIRDFPLSVLFAPLGGVVAGAVILWAVLAWVFGNWRKCAVAASLFVFLYLSYGQFALLFPQWRFAVLGRQVGTAELVAAASAAIFAAACYAVARAKSDLARLTAVLNVISVCLIVEPVFQVVKYEIEMTSEPAANLAAFSEGRAEEPTRAPSPLPSIYYIVLDGYSCADTYREVYGFDNDAFFNYLSAKGFYVAPRARANYPHTYQCIAAALNMQYLDPLVKQMGEEARNRDPIYSALRHSRVRRFVEERGYKFVSFATGFHPTEIKDADEYLVPPGQKGEFANAVWSLTPALSADRKAELDRQRILYTLDMLPELAKSPAPQFVFAHVMAPHPPYVFGRDGKPAATPLDGITGGGSP